MFDKTGTLTKGKLEITDIHIVEKYKDSYTKEQMLEITTTMEKNSEHPLGDAIYKHGIAQKVKVKDIKDFKGIEGKGITGIIEGQRYYMGNKKLMTQQMTEISHVQHIFKELSCQAKTVMFIAKGKELIGLIAVRDEVKDNAANVLRILEDEMGIETVMLTGDNTDTANAIAKELGLSKVIAEVLPEDK